MVNLDISSPPNHTVDPQTGFLESLNYEDAFDAESKAKFLEYYKANNLRLNGTCKALGIKRDTVKKHLKIDPAFRQAVEETHEDWLEELETVSKTSALLPKNVIERIFHMKCHLPERYGQELKQNSTQITIKLDASLVENIKKREQVIEAQVITSALPTENKSVENQGD